VLITLTAIALVLLVMGILGSRPEVRLWVRENIILPVSFLLWVIRLLLRSLDESFVWVIAVLVFALLLVSNLIDALRVSAANRQAEQVRMEPAVPSRGRLGFWLMQIHLVRRGGASFDFARVEFRRLAQAVQAYQGDNSKLEPLPPGLETFLERRPFRVDTDESLSFDWIARLFGRGKPRPPSPDQKVADLTQYLERQLEIRTEDEHR
jgi:hypothetical protein